MLIELKFLEKYIIENVRFTIDAEKTGDFLTWFYMWENRYLLEAAETNEDEGIMHFFAVFGTQRIINELNP